MKIALIVIGSLIGILLIIDIIIFVLVNSIIRYIASKEQAINILMAQKFDLLVTLGKYMEQNDISIPETIKNSLNIGSYDRLKTLNTMERLNIKTLLNKTVNNIFFIAENNGLSENARYLTLKNSINEIDDHYRKNVALYNSQVMAYNYWIKFFIFRPIALICRYRKKEILY
jgi:hypothetical protein